MAARIARTATPAQRHGCRRGRIFRSPGGWTATSRPVPAAGACSGLPAISASLPVPDLSEHAERVLADHLGDVAVRVPVADQPADDVGEGLGWVLDAIDVGHALVLGFWPGPFAHGELRGKRLVPADVIAEVRVRAERDVVDADQVRAVLEM